MIGSLGQRQGSVAQDLCRLAILCALIGASAPAGAETYPARSIRIITPNSPGGIEVNLRAILPRLQAILGQPLVLESRPGASGTLGSELVAKAEPDGYTLLFSTSAPIVTTPLLKSNLRYDQIKDFTPITRILQPMDALVVNTSLPVRSVADLVHHAKANPGALTYARLRRGFTLRSPMPCITRLASK
jgi:tripartite-type tricarboxylate transporter receptor subunit TctC